jgi:hypothetical protein
MRQHARREALLPMRYHPSNVRLFFEFQKFAELLLIKVSDTLLHILQSEAGSSIVPNDGTILGLRDDPAERVGVFGVRVLARFQSVFALAIVSWVFDSSWISLIPAWSGS